MEAFAQSIEGGVVYTWVTSIYWLWPLMETLHFIGLSLLLGGLIVIDTRMAGLLSGASTLRRRTNSCRGCLSGSVLT